VASCGVGRPAQNMSDRAQNCRIPGPFACGVGRPAHNTGCRSTVDRPRACAASQGKPQPGVSTSAAAPERSFNSTLTDLGRDFSNYFWPPRAARNWVLTGGSGRMPFAHRCDSYHPTILRDRWTWPRRPADE
jgi:hypothetical protein